jgi:hypothetical protein
VQSVSETTQIQDSIPDSPPIPHESTFARAVRLRTLREQKLKMDREIKSLKGATSLGDRQQVHCQRCGYDWMPYNPYVPPITCARCGTTAWMLPPTARSRKPSDPPAKCWRTRKEQRRPKVGDSVLRYRGREIRRTRKDRMLTAPPLTPPAPLAPWESAPVVTNLTGPWPWETPAIPPPPSTTDIGRSASVIPPPPTPSLSLQLHQLRDDEYEEQPERMTSHLPPPPPEPEIEEILTTVSTVVEVEQEVIPSEPEPSAGEAPTLPADAPSGDDGESLPIPENVSPELVGAPQTDAEREELAKAKEEAWPTTRSDD